MGKMIGIDLGTTFSAVCAMEGKEPKVIVNSEGARTTPSVVGYSENGEIIVGQLAKRQAVLNPEATVFSVKRFMGKRFEEVGDTSKVSYKVERGPNGDACVNIRGKQLSPPEISAKVLQKLKKAAEDYLGELVDSAVITVPAYFNDAQRQATVAAGKIAGLDVKRIINEPTAAALAYGLDKKSGELVAVPDIGGGTTDCSILEVGDGVVQTISTCGNNELGGDNFDQTIVDWLIAEFKKESGMDVSKDRTVLQRMRDSAEQAKIELSSSQETTISLPFITMDATGPKHLQKVLTRAKFEQMIKPLVESAMVAVRQAMADSGKKVEEINEVLLVGGSTRVPCVIKAIRDFFGKEPHQGVNPDEVVAQGAAIQCAVLEGTITDMVLLDVCPLNLGIETLGGIMNVMVPKNTTIPYSKEEVYSTAADNQPSVDVIILQGNRVQAKDNRILGKFVLDGILPAKRGTPRIKCIFDIDSSGILSVSAVDQTTNRSQRITCKSAGGLSEAEIKRMQDEATKFEAEDAVRKEAIEQRNRLDNLCHTTEQMLFDNKDKMSEQDRESLTKMIADGKSAIEKQDTEAVKASYTVLETEAQRISTSIYTAAQQQEQTPPPQPEVKDAEFTETPQA